MMEDRINDLKEAEKEKLAIDEMETKSANVAATPSKTAVTQENNSWLVGLMLVAIGCGFLLANVVGFRFTNWWALFILIPAVAKLSEAMGSYQRHGRLTHAARGSLMGGLVIGLVAVIFLFNLSWGLMWPFFLIIGGIAALLGAICA